MSLCFILFGIRVLQIIEAWKIAKRHSCYINQSRSDSLLFMSSFLPQCQKICKRLTVQCSSLCNTFLKLLNEEYDFYVTETCWWTVNFLVWHANKLYDLWKIRCTTYYKKKNFLKHISSNWISQPKDLFRYFIT